MIWTGANDGPVYITQNGGGEWSNVTPEDLPGGGRVETIEPSPHAAGKAYFSTYRYLMGDWKPYIYKTEDFGKSWELLTDGANGIPADFPTYVIREDPEKEGLLYAGTMFGAYVSFDDGKQWQPFQQNLPVVTITDMKIHQDDLILSTMGRGFWIMDGLSPLRAMNEEVASAPVTLFPPTDAYRMRYEETDSSAAPMYPTAGVIIDYYLADDVTDAMVEVVDANGKVIRSFSSKTDQGEKVDKTPDMGTGFSALDNQTNLNSQAGGHRMIWDLRQAGPWSETESRRGQGGPMVVPGTYTIRLTANGTTVEETAEVMADPRVMEAGVTATDLKAQEELALQVRDLLSEARKLEYYIVARKGELDSLMEQGKLKGSMKKELAAINEIMDQITTEEGRYMTPMLVDQASYLYYMLEQADQRPGKDAYERYEALQQQYNSLQTNNNEYIESW